MKAKTKALTFKLGDVIDIGCDHRGVVAHVNAGYLFIKPTEVITACGFHFYPWIVAWKVEQSTGRIINLF